jgi:beta-mannosidase
MLTRHSVDQTWRLRPLAGPVPDDVVGHEFPAPVPGDVHTALRAAGAIPDPVVDDNERVVSWIGRTDWEYATTLPAIPRPEAERVELVFAGVDTLAEVFIDEIPRGRSRNMHRTWRVDVPELRRGRADLRLTLQAPVPAGERERERLGSRPSAFSPLAPFLRKKACDFGWDWGPALTGAGIWRSVEIHAWSTARLDAVRPTATLRGEDGVVDLDIDLVRTPQGRASSLLVQARVGASVVEIPVEPGVERVRGRLDVPRPSLWWPAGLGEPALHDLTVTLRLGDEVLDERTQQIGFRDLVVEQVPDAGGVSFRILISGEPLFVRGFNWIPDDTSIASVTPADYRRRIAEAQALGANLIRVWGGGVFEDDEFYRACDEAGMLVWQDFLFACAAYPEEEPFATEVEAEARDNVSRLMSHPSLALWNANNENLWFWFVQDWENVLEGKTWGDRFYFDILPRVLADLDPSRTYLFGSPSSGGRWEDPNDPTRGVVHLWVPGDYREYDRTQPRFVSEFGFQGPPARATFDAAVHEEQHAPFSPGTVQRQKAEGGTERINDVLDIHFGVPTDFDEWYWLAQLNQARAVRFGIERFRTLEPYCAGTIVWQLNDCWPALSWSVIDVADRWKPVAYAVREAYADRIVVLRQEDDGPALFACNSTRVPWEVEIEVLRWRRGDRVGREVVRALVRPHRAERVGLGVLGENLAVDDLLVATSGPRRSVLLGGVDRDYPDEVPDIDVEVVPAAASVAVVITARSLLRDVFLPVDTLAADAHAEQNLLTLLPGESATWTIRTARPEAFTAPAVRAILQTAHAATTRDTAYRGLAQLEAEKAARAASAG